MCFYRAAGGQEAGGRRCGRAPRRERAGTICTIIIYYRNIIYYKNTLYYTIIPCMGAALRDANALVGPTISKDGWRERHGQVETERGRVEGYVGRWIDMDG